MLVRYAVGEATEKELAASASAKKGTCGQKPAPAIAAREIVGTGPGTEPKRLLAKVGIAVTADCPCNESAALMDSNGWAWCEQNLETIIGCGKGRRGAEACSSNSRDGSIHKRLISNLKDLDHGLAIQDDLTARFLAKRAIAKALWRPKVEELHSKRHRWLRNEEDGMNRAFFLMKLVAF